jgi:hypothetical protein
MSKLRSLNEMRGLRATVGVGMGSVDWAVEAMVKLLGIRDENSFQGKREREGKGRNSRQLSRRAVSSIKCPPRAFMSMSVHS